MAVVPAMAGGNGAAAGGQAGGGGHAQQAAAMQMMQPAARLNAMVQQQAAAAAAQQAVAAAQPQRRDTTNEYAALFVALIGAPRCSGDQPWLTQRRSLLDISAGRCSCMRLGARVTDPAAVRLFPRLTMPRQHMSSRRAETILEPLGAWTSPVALMLLSTLQRHHAGRWSPGPSGRRAPFQLPVCRSCNANRSHDARIASSLSSSFNGYHRLLLRLHRRGPQPAGRGQHDGGQGGARLPPLHAGRPGGAGAPGVPEATLRPCTCLTLCDASARILALCIHTCAMPGGACRLVLRHQFKRPLPGRSFATCPAVALTAVRYRCVDGS